MFKTTFSLSLYLSLTLSFLLSGCVSKKPDVFPIKGAISVMAFNVENLFDTLDDPGKRDETYIPRSRKTPRMLAKCSGLAKSHWRQSCQYTDWTEKVLHRKMKRIADVIKQVKSGQGPEIVILPEVENKAVMETLREEYLSGLGYRESVLIEGPDLRGVDVAILTKLEVVGSQSHRVELERAGGAIKKLRSPTRDIIQADLKLPDGRVLTVLGVHFPAPHNPTGARLQAIHRLNEIKRALPKGRLVIAGGDFNITSREENDKALYEKGLGDEWAISHELGCEKCKGTYYYHRDTSWSFLDALLFSKEMLPQSRGPWKVLVQSIRTPTQSLYQVSRYGTPARYREGKGKVGVSDHWPIAAEVVPRNWKGKVQVQ